MSSNVQDAIATLGTTLQAMIGTGVPDRQALRTVAQDLVGAYTTRGSKRSVRRSSRRRRRRR